MNGYSTSGGSVYTEYYADGLNYSEPESYSVSLGGTGEASDDEPEPERELPSLGNTVASAIPQAASWNEKFQNILELKNGYDKFKQLSNLAKDFAYSAKIYGSIIISELFIPNKRIPPLSDMGRAGGDKYICAGILFKLAKDVELNGGRWMYGGDKRNDEKAMKSATHELKGILCYFNSGVERLSYPLLALIHYQGFCLVAVSLLPLQGKTSLVYGSDDGGVSVASAGNGEVNALMKKAGDILGLVSHKVGGTEIVGPADIEAHAVGKRIYVIDFARVMPAEHPYYSKNVNAIWYSLLRPEFVRTQSLCSDLYSAFLNTDPNKSKMEAEGRKATQLLINEVIPNFVRFLTTHTINDIPDLINHLHRFGINIRHLGKVRSLLSALPTSPYLEQLRRLILTEVVARVIKNEWRNALRKLMEDLKVSVSEPFKSATWRLLRPYFLIKKIPSRFELKNASSEDTASVVFNGDTISCGSLSVPVLQMRANYPVSDSQRSFYMEVKLVRGGCGFGFAIDKAETVITQRSDGTSEVTYKDLDKKIQDTQVYLESGDTVGIFYARRERIVMFTKNGAIIGSPMEDVSADESYSVLLGLTPHSEISVNFGSRSYKFKELIAFANYLHVPPPDQIGQLLAEYNETWFDRIKVRLNESYRDALTPAEQAPTYNLTESVDLGLQLQRVQTLTLIQFAPRVAAEIAKGSFVLSKDDIVELGSRVRHMGIIDFARAVKLYYATQKRGFESNDSLQSLYQARQLIYDAISSSPMCQTDYFYYQALILNQIAKLESPDAKSQSEQMSLLGFERVVMECQEKNAVPLTAQDRQNMLHSLYCIGEIHFDRHTNRPGYLSSYKSSALQPYFEAMVAEGGASMIREQLKARCQAQIILPNKDKLVKNLLFLHLLRSASKPTEVTPESKELDRYYFLHLLKLLSVFFGKVNGWQFIQLPKEPVQAIEPDVIAYALSELSLLWKDAFTLADVKELLDAFFKAPSHGNEIAFLLKLNMMHNTLDTNLIPFFPAQIPLTSSSLLLQKTIAELSETKYLKDSHVKQYAEFQRVLAHLLTRPIIDDCVHGFYLQLRINEDVEKFNLERQKKEEEERLKRKQEEERERRERAENAKPEFFEDEADEDEKKEAENEENEEKEEKEKEQPAKAKTKSRASAVKVDAAKNAQRLKKSKKETVSDPRMEEERRRRSADEEKQRARKDEERKAIEFERERQHIADLKLQAERKEKEEDKRHTRPLRPSAPSREMVQRDSLESLKSMEAEISSSLQRNSTIDAIERQEDKPRSSSSSIFSSFTFGGGGDAKPQEVTQQESSWFFGMFSGFGRKSELTPTQPTAPKPQDAMGPMPNRLEESNMKPSDSDFDTLGVEFEASDPITLLDISSPITKKIEAEVDLNVASPRSQKSPVRKSSGEGDKKASTALLRSVSSSPRGRHSSVDAKPAQSGEPKIGSPAPHQPLATQQQQYQKSLMKQSQENIVLSQPAQGPSQPVQSASQPAQGPSQPVDSPLRRARAPITVSRSTEAEPQAQGQPQAQPQPQPQPQAQPQAEGKRDQPKPLPASKPMLSAPTPQLPSSSSSSRSSFALTSTGRGGSRPDLGTKDKEAKEKAKDAKAKGKVASSSDDADVKLRQTVVEDTRKADVSRQAEPKHAHSAESSDGGDQDAEDKDNGEEEKLTEKDLKLAKKKGSFGAVASIKSLVSGKGSARDKDGDKAEAEPELPSKRTRSDKKEKLASPRKSHAPTSTSVATTPTTNNNTNVPVGFGSDALRLPFLSAPPKPITAISASVTAPVERIVPFMASGAAKPGYVADVLLGDDEDIDVDMGEGGPTRPLESVVVVDRKEKGKPAKLEPFVVDGPDDALMMMYRHRRKLEGDKKVHGDANANKFFNEYRGITQASLVNQYQILKAAKAMINFFCEKQEFPLSQGTVFLSQLFIEVSMHQHDEEDSHLHPVQFCCLKLWNSRLTLREHSFRAMLNDLFVTNGEAFNTSIELFKQLGVVAKGFSMFTKSAIDNVITLQSHIKVRKALAPHFVVGKSFEIQHFLNATFEGVQERKEESYVFTEPSFLGVSKAESQGEFLDIDLVLRLDPADLKKTAAAYYDISQFSVKQAILPPFTLYCITEVRSALLKGASGLVVSVKLHL